MTSKLRATPYLFLAPALVLLGIFVIYPIFAVIYYSFTDYDIIRPPVCDRPRELPEPVRGRDVLAGADPFVRLPAGHADPDRAVDRAGHRGQPPAARDPHLSGALLRACGQRQHRHRAVLALAVRADRVHQQHAAVARLDLGTRPVAGHAGPRPADRDAADDLGGLRLLRGHLPGRAPEHPRGALRRGHDRWRDERSRSTAT